MLTLIRTALVGVWIMCSIHNTLMSEINQTVTNLLSHGIQTIQWSEILDTLTIII